MNLYLIRHAIAADPGPEFEDDSQRPLTEKGRRKMVNIARGLKTLDTRFELMISSPYLRALDTARILAKTLHMEQDEIAISENLTPTAPPAQIIGEINEKYASAGSIALVGHEPLLSSLIGLLTAGDETISITMKKGGVCLLSAENLFHERRATLEWLLMPRHLAALGDWD